MVNLLVVTASLLTQCFVIYFSFRLWRILNPVRYWSNAWLLYTIANLSILIRRIIGVYVTACAGGYEIISPNMTLAWPVLVENLVQIFVSVLLLAFVWNLRKLYIKYFENGLNIQSWKEEQRATNNGRI
jgi:hypothetical protein